MDYMIVPEQVRHLEMCRHWWIAYKWEVVQNVGDEEPLYIRSSFRPINEATNAAAEFDELWKTGLLLDKKHNTGE